MRLSFGQLPAMVSGGTTTAATVSITDEDNPDVRVSFDRGSYTVSEGSPVTIRISLSADPERSVTIPLVKTGLGGATSTDFSGVPDSVTFGSGAVQHSFAFVAVQDTEDDDGESVELRFGPLPAMVSGGTTTAATVSITDDDDPDVTVSFGSGVVQCH